MSQGLPIDKFILDTKLHQGFQDVNSLLKSMQSQRRKQRLIQSDHIRTQQSVESSQHYQQTSGNGRAQTSLNQEQQQQPGNKPKILTKVQQANEEYFAMSVNSFLFAEKPPKEEFDTKTLQQSKSLTQSSFFRNTNSNFNNKQHRLMTSSDFPTRSRCVQNQEAAELQDQLRRLLNSGSSRKLEQTDRIIVQKLQKSGGLWFQKPEKLTITEVISKNNNPMNSHGQLSQMNSQSQENIIIQGNFRPFKDLADQQFMDRMADMSVETLDKIKYHLKHNNQQRALINHQLNTQRFTSFENFLLRKNHADNLLTKACTSHRAHHNAMPTQMNSISQMQSQPPIERLDTEEESSSTNELQNQPQQQQQQYVLDRLQFHWEKVIDYTNEMKPEFREDGTLVEFKKSFFLYGGFGVEVMNSVYEYRLREYRWKKVETNGALVPSVGRFGHTSNMMKNYMVVFGGGGEYDKKMKTRLVFNEVWLLNLENKEWKQVRTVGEYVEPRRNHAAAIVGGNLLISGGVNSLEHYISSLHLLQFDQQLERGRWKTWNLKQDEMGVAFHTMIPVFKKLFKPKIVARGAPKAPGIKIKEEGVYCFGGKQGNEQLRSRLMILRCDAKDQPIEWITPDTTGQSPPGRFQHAMFLNSQLQCLGIFGGRCDGLGATQGAFQDVWLLSLSNLQWTKVQQISGTLNRFRFATAYVSIDERLFVFGGASDVSYTDCELYTLEMEPTFARRKRNNPVRDFVTRQASIQRLDIDEIEHAVVEKEEPKRRGSAVKTFLRPPTKIQLKQIDKPAPKIMHFPSFQNGDMSPTMSTISSPRPYLNLKKQAHFQTSQQ